MRRSRLTKYGKIIFGSIIVVVLLATLALFVAKEKFYTPEKNEDYKAAKVNQNYKMEEKIAKTKGTGIKDRIDTQLGLNTNKKTIEDADISIEEPNDFGENLSNEENVPVIAYQDIENNNTENKNTNEEKNIDVMDEDIKIEETESDFQRDLTQFSGKKLVAFTFDDGPNSETTNRLLDNLEKYNARVTFFVLGSRVNNNANTLKRAHSMGNQIGSHTYSHSNFFTLNNYQIIDEIQKTNETIKNAIGIEPTLIRPPYGNTNYEIKNMSNMYTILWDLDTEDWKDKNPDRIVEYIVNNVHDGSIILFHDIYDTSIDGALRAMELLYWQGYAFVTIDEMIQLKNVELDKNISYHYFTD